MHVYKITNELDGRSYIGITSRDPKKRWREHVCNSSKCEKTDTLLYSEMAKYGEESFVFDVIDSSAKTYDELLMLEISYIKEHSTLIPLGYNMTNGGVGGDNLHLYDADRRSAIYKQIGEKNRQRYENDPLLREECGERSKRFWKDIKGDPTRYSKYKSNLCKAQQKRWDATVLTDENREMYSKGQKARWNNESEDMKKHRKKALTEGQRMTWRKWRLTQPDGTVILVDGIHRYCKDNGLSYYKIYNTFRRGKMSKEGWFLEQLND